MRGVRVLLRHVRAHRGHAMNERADTLAGLGAQGVRMRDGRPFDPPDYPDPSHARSATPVRPLYLQIQCQISASQCTCA